MPFVLNPEGILESTLLGELKWLAHGFATRASDGWPQDYTFVRQIHSDRVLVAGNETGCLGEGDALLSEIPGRWIGVRTADCVPLLLADPEHRAVAAIHAGWRGTISDIVGQAVSVMAQRYGSVPGNLIGAIGPCIGPCCFEVGPEVSARFRDLFPDGRDLRNINLVEANIRQLERAGAQRENVDVSGLCTKCAEEQFHSYRRDKELAGRMVAAIQVK